MSVFCTIKSRFKHRSVARYMSPSTTALRCRFTIWYPIWRHIIRFYFSPPPTPGHWTLHIQSCDISTPRRAYSPAAISARIEHITVHIVISVLPGTHFHLSQGEAFESEVGLPCPTQHRNKVPRLSYLKILTKQYSKPHGRQRHRQSATL